MVRRVAVRTVANAQESSGSLYQRPSTPASPNTQIGMSVEPRYDPLRTEAREQTPGYVPRDRTSRTIQVQDQLIDPLGIPLMYQSDANPRYETRPNPDFDPLLAAQQPTGLYGPGGTLGQAGLSQYWEGVTDQLREQRNAEDLQTIGGRAYGDRQAQSIFSMLQVNMATAQATADSMIKFAVDNASQPYDEALRRVDRDILDTAGQMDDLDKITDYYKARLIDPWEKAAAEARTVDPTNIFKQAASTVAEVGKVFDTANKETQAYLDRIGGVPVAQKVAIADTVQYLLDPFEGLVEAEAQTLGSIVDATGTLLEKQAARALTSANLEAETNRFVIDAALSDTMEDMNLERTDILGNRARAIKSAREQAQAQYGVTGMMPDKEQVLQMAGMAVFEDLGIDAVQQQEWYDKYMQLRSTNGLPVAYQKVIDPETGEQMKDEYGELMWDKSLEGTIFIDTTDPVAFEKAYSELDDYYQDPELLEVMMPLLYTLNKTGLMWDAKDTANRSVGGAAAPDNWKNRNEPRYVERRNMTTNMIPVILNQFPGLHVTSQSRTLSHNQEIGGAANSDHLAGGALDLGFSSKSEADRAAEWLRGLPNVRLVLWQTKGHYDHIHVSFRLPEDISDSSIVNSFTDNTWSTPEVIGQDAPTQVSGGIDPATRELVRGAFSN